MRRVWVLLVLGACAVEAEDFPETAARAYCEKADRCDSLETSLDFCLDSMEGVWRAVIEVGEALGGEYESANAGKCIRDIRSLSCDDIESGDVDVASCDDLFVEEG